MFGPCGKMSKVTQHTRLFRWGRKKVFAESIWKYFPITSSISHSPVQDIASEIYFSLLAPFLFHFHLKDKQTEACLVLKQSRGENRKGEDGKGWAAAGLPVSVASYC